MNIDNPVSFFKNYDVAAIGPTTKSAIENSKVSVSIMPDEFTIKSLANKMIEFYNKNEK
jgi:uroporphyrinogen-III synthase